MLNTTISERIKSTIKSKKLTLNGMILNCELNRNFMYDLSQNKTLKSAETLKSIADYLDCSVDYLLGRTDNPDSHKL